VKINPWKLFKRKIAAFRQRQLVEKVMQSKKMARGHLYKEHPRLSVLIQSFNHVANISQIMNHLRRAEAEEIIVCEDGSIDGSHETWMGHLDHPNDFLIHSNDLHEIRTTDRAIALSRGEFVCLIQDDDLLPPDGRWIKHALSLFGAYPNLGCLGGFMGFPNCNVDECFQGFSIKDGMLLCHNPIPTKDPLTGYPFMFIENVNIGPYFLRKSAFQSVGGWDISFSEVGKPGMGYDHEMGYRMWSRGFQVGLYYAPLFNSEFNEQAGKGGTYLWGREDRKQALKSFPEKIHNMYKDEMSVIRKRIQNANSSLIPITDDYFQQTPR
jgi:glycosyltransferase involved in cell wall biosynthesis